MKLRIKKMNTDGLVRLESSGNIVEILVNEDFLHKDEESISICFRGRNSSGIVDLTMEEAKKIVDVLDAKKHLIKDFKVLRFEK